MASQSTLMAAHLRGQQLRLPDLRAICAHWPSAINPRKEELVDAINEKVKEWLPNAEFRDKLKKIDLPLFTATWWPNAPLDRLMTAALYGLWLFVWDDDIERAGYDADNDTLGGKTVQQLQENALVYMAYHLGLLDAASSEPKLPTKSMLIVKDPCLALKRDYSEASRWRFWNEVKFFMECCAGEHEHLKSGVLPPVQEFWELRLGTSSVYTVCSLAEYMAGGCIPNELVDSNANKALWFEVNRHVILVNDMLSLRKEVNSSVYSLLPVVMNDTGRDLDSTVAIVLEDLYYSTAVVDNAARVLLTEVARDPAAFKRVKAYVDVMRTTLTGNIHWSLACGRYGVTQFIGNDGSLTIPL